MPHVFMFDDNVKDLKAKTSHKDSCKNRFTAKRNGIELANIVNERPKK